ncbi:hypothetical protein G6F22_017445 [Rhizopus arrhizus]|nr:hypothetical protein G6F22_017445 [Rhizopus arrhizus]
MAEAAERNLRQGAVVQRGIFAAAAVPQAVVELDRAGRDGIDPDPVLGQRQRLRGGVVRERSLGRSIGRATGARLLRGNRRQIEDAGVVGHAQPRQGQARGTNGRHQVDLQAGRPSVLVVGHAVTGGIVDQHVDATECVGGGLQPALDLTGVSQVGGERTETCAPAPANASAISRPMPLLPPAISTRRPL